jgi:hypothetical protein
MAFGPNFRTLIQDQHAWRIKAPAVEELAKPILFFSLREHAGQSPKKASTTAETAALNFKFVP